MTYVTTLRVDGDPTALAANFEPGADDLPADDPISAAQALLEKWRRPRRAHLDAGYSRARTYTITVVDTGE